MSKAFLFLFLFIVVALVCLSCVAVAVAPYASPTSLTSQSVIPPTDALTESPFDVTPIPVMSAPSAPATASSPAPGGVAVSYGPLSVVMPLGLASGISGAQLPRSEGDNVAPWDVTPGHTQLRLEGYLLQGKNHQPQIYIYPAQGYAEMHPAAFESIRRLNNILYSSSVPVSADQLPTVPFFNAKQAFASNIQVVAFENGGGVRFLTEYAQYPVSANNQDLFYHFQGVTRDGAYYIVANLPIAVPVLAETNDGGAVLPAGGVPYPDITSSSADKLAYYSAVTALLDGTSPEAFAPTINQLDALIQSMRVTR